MGENFRTGAESCRWISLQTVTLFTQVCNLTNHEKSEMHQE